MRRALTCLLLLPALGAGSSPAFALGVEILPSGTIRGEGGVAAVSLRVTCTAQDRRFTGIVTIVQGAARGTTSVRGGCAVAGTGVVQIAVPADRSLRRPPFLRGVARASARLSPDDSLQGGRGAAHAREVELR